MGWGQKWFGEKIMDLDDFEPIETKQLPTGAETKQPGMDNRIGRWRDRRAADFLGSCRDQERWIIPKKGICVKETKLRSEAL